MTNQAYQLCKFMNEGFLISFSGIVIMFISIAYMAYREPENLLDGDWDD